MDTHEQKRAVALVVAGFLLLALASCHSAPARAESILRIYLARHGQTDWNLEERTQGGTDIPLNDTGRQQANQLRARLAGLHLDAVYSSNLQRSRVTAEIARGDTPLFSLGDLGERGFGKFEGLLRTDPDIGSELERRKWVPADDLDDGESLDVFRDRVRRAIDTIRKERESGAILIVGHAHTNQMILATVLGWSVDQMRSINQANDELYLIELRTGASPRLWKLFE